MVTSTFHRDIRHPRIAAFLEALTAAHVLFPTAIVMVAVAGFAFGRSMGPAVFLIATAMTVLAVRAFSTSWREAGLVAAAAAVVHVAAGMIAGALPDGSFDGLAYHQEAILRLAAGWNPLFENSSLYGIGNDIFINHYPKASWISGAAVLLSTGHIEPGKLLNITLMIAAGAMVTAALLRLTKLSAPVSAGIGILAALNPVAVSQSETFYVDGALASLLTILIASLALWVVELGWRSLAVALLAFVLAANLKFTGLVYGAVFLAPAVLLVWYRHGVRAAVNMAVVVAVTVCIATLLIGFSPYVKNVREHGDPFYPIHGAPEVVGLGPDGSNRPANLNGRNRVMRFLIANLSFSQQVRAPRSTTLKVPLRISRAELWGGVYSADLEAGGFGPLYGGLLLLSCVGGVLLIAQKDLRYSRMGVSVIGLSLLVSMFVHSETWWARYAPQAWLLPLLVVIPSMSLPRRSPQWRLGCAVAGFACLNVLVVLFNVVHGQLAYARATRTTLREMAVANQPVSVDLGGFGPLRRRLQEAGVDFTIVEPPMQAGRVRHPLPSSGGQRSFWFEWSKGHSPAHDQYPRNFCVLP